MNIKNKVKRYCTGWEGSTGQTKEVLKIIELGKEANRNGYQERRVETWRSVEGRNWRYGFRSDILLGDNHRL